MAYDTDTRWRAEAGLGDFNFWDTFNDITETVAKVAGTARVAAPQVKDVIEGRSSVVTVPKGQTTIVSGTGTKLGVAMPAWILPVAGAGLLYLAFRKR